MLVKTIESPKIRPTPEDDLNAISVLAEEMQPVIAARVAEFAARVRRMTSEEVAQATSHNAQRLFGI